MALRIAYLILAHRLPGHLVRLVNRLQGRDRTIIVHADQKSAGLEWDETLRLLEGQGVILADRIACSWGNFSLVQATLNCIGKIPGGPSQFDFVVLLSGQDYPIKPVSELEQFLDARRGNCFMFFHRFPYPEWEYNGYDRLATWRVPVGRRRRRIVIPTLARRFHKKVPYGYHPCGGSQWWALPGNVVQYIQEFASKHPEFVSYYRRSLYSDEMFFHTILGNSHFHLEPGDHHLHTIAWTKDKTPTIVNESDFARLQASERFFARKFDLPSSARLLDRIDDELLGLPAGSVHVAPAGASEIS